jgi:hypothetical protein
MVIIGKLIDRCESPKPVCNSDMLVKADLAKFCSSAQNVVKDCKSDRTAKIPEDRRYLANPKYPIDSNVDLKKYYAFAKMQGWFDIYHATDNTDERAEMEKQLTETAVEVICL